MRMHTAQHLVSGLAYEMFDGVRTVGNQIHADRSRIDFNPISFDETMLNDLLHGGQRSRIDSGLEVSDNVMTRGEINAIMPPERTNMDLLPISVKQLRIVQIGDRVDMCPLSCRYNPSSLPRHDIVRACHCRVGGEDCQHIAIHPGHGSRFSRRGHIELDALAFILIISVLFKKSKGRKGHNAFPTGSTHRHPGVGNHLVRSPTTNVL